MRVYQHNITLAVEPLIITMVTFICTSPTLDSSYLKEGYRKDKDKKNISPWGPACKWGMFATCLQPVQALPVFTLHFSWQLSANSFCQLFHVQSWKSAKLNSFSIRSFTVCWLGCRAFSLQSSVWAVSLWQYVTGYWQLISELVNDTYILLTLKLYRACLLSLHGQEKGCISRTFAACVAFSGVCPSLVENAEQCCLFYHR